MEESGMLARCRYLLHDRDSKYCPSFRQLIEGENVKCLALPPKSPNLNAFAERWVRSVKEECLSKLILFGERSLKRALHHYEIHYHRERNHQGKNNMLLFPSPAQLRNRNQEKLRCRQRLGGLLKYYEGVAA
jgi:hypothetical protein